MKKLQTLLLLGVIWVFLGNPVWADTIDEVSLAETTLTISGTYSDACPRHPVILQTALEDDIVIQIFTVIPPPDTACAAVITPYTLSVEIDPPGEKSYKIIVLLYKGMPGVDENVDLQDSEMLIVDDGAGDTIEALVNITPKTINMKRNGQFITSRITPPEGYTAGDIDAESITLCIENNSSPVEETPDTSVIDEAYFDFAPVTATDLVCGDFAPRWTVVDELSDSLIVKFPNQDVLSLIGENVTEFPAMVTFVIQGEISGMDFEATDTVRVISPGKNKGKGKGKK